MDKSERLIMAVERGLLLGEDHFEGFRSEREVDYEVRILGNYKYMKRGPLEEDPSHKQPIAYALIVNPGLRRIFAYRRAEKDEHYGEKRLQGMWSWGVGGHIERRTEGGDGNPIHSSLLRELGEEVSMNGQVTRIKKLGYINNEQKHVERVHFGILYLIETDSTEIKPEAPEIAEGRLMELSELEEILASEDCKVEEWSKIALGPLRELI